MKNVGCIQSFSGRNAFIVSEDLGAIERLEQSLVKLGMCVFYIDSTNETIHLDKKKITKEWDVLFLDGDLGTRVNIPNHPILDLSIVPVIGMVGIEAPSRLGKLYLHGATAFIKKPIHVGSVFSTLFMAVNDYERRVSYESTLRSHEDRRRQRRFVVKAVILLMQRYRFSDQEAYEWLRQQSMQTRVSIEDFCQNLVEEQTQPDVVLSL